MFRMGIGYDIHRLEEGRPLIIGGEHIPFDKGLAGHSDADVLAHAIVDALLGAAALGDIGRLFPDTEPEYKDADSMALLAEAVTRVRAAGFEIVNIDSNVIAEQPKLSGHIDAMRENLAKHLSIPAASISVKAKTNERVGPEGKGEAIRAQAVALIEST